VLIFACTLTAQIRTGNIYGKVVDVDGNALPGVTLTVTGQRTGTMTAISTTEGVFRFLSLAPGSDYIVKAELEGFNTAIKTNIIMAVGSNLQIEIVMEMGSLEEEVTVTAVTPVVDSKRTSVGTNVTQEVLQSLPTARDPWVVLQMAPSVITDRENIGGVESGQQSSYVARGAASYSNNVWAMDGLVITDPAAIGASPSYYDFDAFEEMNIVVGGADVTIQTGGVALNMVTRRGGNRVSLGGRFYLVDKKFQATNEDYVAEVQLDEPRFLGLNLIRENKDYGFNLGLPLVKDKAWFWMSYGVMDIKTRTVYQRNDDTLLSNVAAKLNLQIIPENRFEAFIHVGRKNKYGRSSSSALPGGYYQGGRYHFGSPIIKFQDEHMFGDNLFVSFKVGFSDAGFNLTPMDDRNFEHTVFYDRTNRIFEGPDGLVGEWRYYVERPVNQYNLLANYFNDSLFGASHDMKIGVEFADRNSYTESVYVGNMQINWNYNTATMDFTGDGARDLPGNDFYRFMYWRGYYRDYGVKALAGYFSDTISFGRFTLLLGFRYDYQHPRINPVSISAMNSDPGWDVASAAVQTQLDAMLPAIDISEKAAVDTDGNTWAWKTFSPRIGITWDVTGDGKTIAKLSFAQYGDFMGVGSWSQMPGGASGWIDFWWWDDSQRAANGLVELDELYWHTVGDGTYTPVQLFPGGGAFAGSWADAAGDFWGGYDYANPMALTDPYQTRNANAGSSRTTEIMAVLEKEVMTDFAVAANITYRKYDNYNWTQKYFKDAAGNAYGYQTQDWWADYSLPITSISQYLPAGYTVWDGSLGDAPNHTYQYQVGDYNGYDPSYYSPWSTVTQRPDMYRDYMGLDIIFNKRLSNKWMLTGSFTIQHQALHYGDKGYWNNTNLWAVEGQSYAAYMGGASGKINQYTYSRWLFKVGGLYQLPYDINFSFTFQAREGWVIRERLYFYDYAIPNVRNRGRWLYLNKFGDDRLDTFYKLDIRIEKVLKSGDFGKIYLMLDFFNALNSTHENRRYQKDWGEFYYYGTNDARNYFRAYGEAYTLNEVLNPRVMRVGIRFTF
jgi:hypothetical protein